jgi:hypothetical protein
LIIRRLILPLTVAALAVSAVAANAQGAFPAPLPGQSVQQNDPAFPPVNGAPRSDPAFPPVNGGGAPRASFGNPSAFPSGGAAPVTGGFSAAPPQQAGPPGGEDCMKGFMPLRQDAEKRGAAIKAASERHAPPDEACKLIGNFSQAEVKMIKYVQVNAQKCGIPAQISDQLKKGHTNTENMMKKVCNVAQQQQQRGPAGPTLSDVLGSSAALPEATATKKGGSTFDTLNGNVLTR